MYIYFERCRPVTPQGEYDLKCMLGQAYKKLKAYTYYDKTMAILRGKISQFERDYEKKISNLVDNLNSEKGESELQTLLNSINYYIFPKSVTRSRYDIDAVQKSKCCSCSNLHSKSANDNDIVNQLKRPPEQGEIISNYTDTSFEISDCNLFIKANIEVHILGALWTMEIGSILDKEMYSGSLGNKLRPEIFDEVKSGGNYSPHLFRYYFKEYEKWRSDAIDVTKKITDLDKGGDNNDPGPFFFLLYRNSRMMSYKYVATFF